MMSFVTAGTAGGAGLGSAQVFGAGQFVGRIVDDFIGLETGWGIGAEALDFAGKNHQDEE
jgi:hypothetical protein